MVTLERPVDMFDREFEWDALTRFATDDAGGATLGVVSGRRRQGKTFLLRALCEATGGFFFGADEATDGESLRRIGSALADRVSAPAPLMFDDWYPVFDALLELGRERTVPVVIDEFPYLVRANPRLPSIIQNVLAPRRSQRDESRTRLLLCGSAMSFMGGLLAGGAPLRGRAGLELVVATLDHQLAARFWGVDDPVTALKLHAIVGGTPAYRREFARDDTPAGPDDFDAWVTRTVLSPTSALFREGRYLLADEPDLRDTALYHSVLAAIAEGNASRGGIASYLGRKSGDLAHSLTVLADCGLITREPDAFRDNRTQFRIAEPLVTFYHAVMRPMWSDLEHARGTRRLAQLWKIGQRRFVGNVLGPHFEQVCRSWTAHHAAPERFGGGLVSRVATGVVNDPSARTSHQLDVVAFSYDGDQERLLMIGEAKWGDTMGLAHLERLRRIRELLSAQDRPGAATTRLACFSMAGFSEQLVAAAGQSPDILLVGPADLYEPI
ncbi:putative ATP/GTP binding protein [Candidatus Protofrankia datiscae]|uniref:Putative ATP/GTP binding protein n=1 Tax=Candidatus Protofrankia datiscae TaxID=2716812 RepID=F8B6Q2_9ACTN|nr:MULTISPECIES: ATP-binding protein [Protofrankia]AEH10266.1 putative ATP/GTP binding protein [Candidatus Protofrankia datiscae]